MAANPKISIVVPNYNKGKHVATCLESVKNQTFIDWELFFIDDHSDDDSVITAKFLALEDNRINVLRNDTGKKGANSCRNSGIDKANSDYILFFDSDDIMTKDCLEERWNDLAKNEKDTILVHQTGLFFDELYDSNLVCNVEKNIPHLDRFLERDLVWLISGPLWPKQVLIELGGFDTKLKSHQEYDLHVRALIKNYNFRFLPKEPKVFYRQNVESESRKNSQSVEHFQARVEMTFNHLHLLKKYGSLNSEREILIARYLLDIAQMMRWHKVELGRESLTYALSIWSEVYEESIIKDRVYHLGNRFIQFKHQMFFNRIPLIQKAVDALFHKALSNYIHLPSQTFCKTEYSS